MSTTLLKNSNSKNANTALFLCTDLHKRIFQMKKDLELAEIKKLISKNLKRKISFFNLFYCQRKHNCYHWITFMEFKKKGYNNDQIYEQFLLWAFEYYEDCDFYDDYYDFWDNYDSCNEELDVESDYE